ncbi:pirin family protein [Corynebacterium freneyi]|nr:pirin family protein [Corynebacterium freneyi]
MSDMTTMAVLEPRDVPLGGYRSITVRRTLPHIERTSVGPFIFADHFGPTEPAMDIAPHPHTHLATCTWLFSGRVRHADRGLHHFTTRAVVSEATITAGRDGAVLILLAGDPYGEDLLMFWNFVGDDESAVRSAREDWENVETRASRFGVVEGYPGFDGEPTRAQIDRIPAPPMPSVKLRPRRNK